MPQDLIGQALPRANLTARDIASMYDLFQAHFTEKW